MNRSNSGSMKLGNVPSASGGITRLACARIRNTGIQLTPLLSQAGITEEQVENGEARIAVRSQIQFLELAGEALGDDWLGFHLAREFDLRQIGLIYYVLASSGALGESLLKAERYCQIVNEGISLRLRAGNELAIVFDYVGVQRHPDHHQIEFWITTFLRLCRELTKRHLTPSRVAVMHHHKQGVSNLRSFMGCEIEFGAKSDLLAFPKGSDSMPIVSADTHLNELLIKYCEEALARSVRSRRSIRSDVENAIAVELPHGASQAGEIARKLGMSQRTLARRLAAEELSFTEIVDELKRKLADRYLRDAELSISQIAWLLGYRENSAFAHAFKRWTGKSPREARRRAA
jgi:AraC-like DNA-binding protein